MLATVLYFQALGVADANDCAPPPGTLCGYMTVLYFQTLSVAAVIEFFVCQQVFLTDYTTSF